MAEEESDSERKYWEKTDMGLALLCWICLQWGDVFMTEKPEQVLIQTSEWSLLHSFNLWGTTSDVEWRSIVAASNLYYLNK